MIQRGRTPSTSSFTAGERKLPGGRALSAALLAFIASCGPAAATPLPSVAAPPVATPTASARPSDTTPPIPTLGTKPPSGLVLPSYFVTVTSSGNGNLTVLTSAASVCDLTVRAPSGSTIDAGRQVADPGGLARWSYTPVSERGESILTATCTLGDQTETAKAQVLLP